MVPDDRNGCSGVRTELLVAECVVEMRVGVHQHMDTGWCEYVQVDGEFGRLSW